MSATLECPRCDKQVPLDACFCSRCGLRLGYGRSRGPAAGGTPSRRLARLLVVGACLALLGALATRPAKSKPVILPAPVHVGD